MKKTQGDGILEFLVPGYCDHLLNEEVSPPSLFSKFLLGVMSDSLSARRYVGNTPYFSDLSLFMVNATWSLSSGKPLSQLKSIFLM